MMRTAGLLSFPAQNAVYIIKLGYTLVREQGTMFTNPAGTRWPPAVRQMADEPKSLSEVGMARRANRIFDVPADVIAHAMFCTAVALKGTLRRESLVALTAAEVKSTANSGVGVPRMQSIQNRLREINRSRNLLS